VGSGLNDGEHHETLRRILALGIVLAAGGLRHSIVMTPDSHALTADGLQR